ncbi:MAG: SDR family NAD(P)-dependent oxidoreductase, partial [Acidimicrobiia bacterium]|nr:SDR family NAD(P)-dependent oxidoreductase [Acidimicrobiia bacterium]
SPTVKAMDLTDRRALVTGASRGIGAAIARRLSRAGCEVIVAARTTVDLETIATETGGHAVHLDAADPAQVDGFIDRVEADRGPIDLLVSNAGVEAMNLIDRTGADEIEHIMRVNLLTPQHLTSQVLPGMIDRGRGHLLYTSSLAATAAAPAMSVYCASKAGLTRFAESVRMELKNLDVGVTVLHLGPVDTDMWERIESEPAGRSMLRRGQCLGYVVTVSSNTVADAAVKAVQRNQREVRLPRRMALAPFITGLGTRGQEAILAGVDPRADVD